jgi:hypothetical protein
MYGYLYSTGQFPVRASFFCFLWPKKRRGDPAQPRTARDTAIGQSRNGDFKFLPTISCCRGDLPLRFSFRCLN